MNDLKDIGGKKKALVILVGPPASGKSTWGKKFALDNGVVYVSTDEIRKEIGAGEGDQTVSAAAFGIARGRISSALRANKSAMIDATSVSRKARKDWINLGKGHGAFIIAVAFEVPKDELLRRDAKRERHVGPEVIDRFLYKYQRPTEQEVDKVIILGLKLWNNGEPLKSPCNLCQIILSATPLQLCEALLKAVNKWKE